MWLIAMSAGVWFDSNVGWGLSVVESDVSWRWGVVDSNVGWRVEVGVVDSEVGKRWQVRVMFDELVAVGSVVEMGEAQQVSWKINERLHI